MNILLTAIIFITHFFGLYCAYQIGKCRGNIEGMNWALDVLDEVIDQYKESKA